MRYASIAAVMAAVLLAACSSSSDETSAGSTQLGMLRGTSAAELEASLKAGLAGPAGSRSEALIAAVGLSSGDTQTGNFTGTYTQEPSVDEFDAVRYDGSHLYVAPQRYMTCCFVQPAAAEGASSSPEPQPAIRILTTDPTNGTATPVGEIPLPDGTSVQGMYLSGGTMLALTSEAYYGSYGRFWTDIAIWAPQKHGFRVYDVRDPSEPELRAEAIIDGVFVESRRVGDTVYIVSRYTPSLPGLSYSGDDAARVANEALLGDVTLADLLPKIEINGVTRPLVDPEDCYVSSEPEDEGYAVLTSITAVPLADPDAFRTTCYNEDAYGVYVSAAALYLTELRADTALRRSFTRIHKFALGGTSLGYRGSAEIDGQVWRGGQADFRLSERDGDLRAFVSEYDWTSDDFVDHKLYVLREDPSARELAVLSQLPNDDRPQEVGKPNEQLFGVRFFGARAYAVTFEQIDPLYVIDLTDPADPRIAGSLEVAGVSDFLHPVTDDLLLGLGAAAGGGIKLELFDVSDLARPLSRGGATLGGSGSYSEARHDRHAFAYQVGGDGVDRFAIPATVYSASGDHSFVESGLYLYEIRDKASVSLATLNAVGALITDRAGDASPIFYAGRNRAFIHDDVVYYVRDEEVFGARWSSPSMVTGPF